MPGTGNQEPGTGTTTQDADADAEETTAGDSTSYSPWQCAVVALGARNVVQGPGHAAK